jgi:hypothetical protein
VIHSGVQKIIDVLKHVDNSETSKLGFDMNYESSACEGTEHPCGSACCIGGHAAFALGDPYMSISQALSDLCTIPHDDAYDICWPDGINYEEITLEQAISMLENYRDTGEIDWSGV